MRHTTARKSTSAPPRRKVARLGPENPGATGNQNNEESDDDVVALSSSGSESDDGSKKSGSSTKTRTVPLRRARKLTGALPASLSSNDRPEVEGKPIGGLAGRKWELLQLGTQEDDPPIPNRKKHTAMKSTGCPPKYRTLLPEPVAERSGRLGTLARKSTGGPPNWRADGEEKPVTTLDVDSEPEPVSKSANQPAQQKYRSGGKQWSKILACNSNNGSTPMQVHKNGSSIATEINISDDEVTQELTSSEDEATEPSFSDSILKLDGWNQIESSDHRPETFLKEYSFNNFKEAWNFMSQVTIKLQIMDHHPDWHQMNNKVKVYLPSADTKQLTSKDLVLAQFMEKIAANS